MALERVISKKLGQLLIEAGKIDKVQLEESLEYQNKVGGALGEILVAKRFVTEDEIAGCLAIQYGLPFLSLQNYQLDAKILSLIPKEIILKNLCIPLDQMGNVLTVAVSDPLDSKILSEIEKQTGNRIQYFICTINDIRKAIEKNIVKK